jgi:hypothetical protein
MMAVLRSRAVRGLVLASTLGLSLTESGCYEYSQVPSEAVRVVPGSSFSFIINDQGRVGLADKLGPSVAWVEGKYFGLVQNQYAVDVYTVDSFTAGRSRWVGERVQIPREYVAGISERKLSKGKTALVVAAALTAVGVFIAAQNLNGSGIAPGEGRPPDGSGAVRIPHGSGAVRIPR